MTMAEQLVQQGIQEGIQQGVHVGKEELLVGLLEKKFRVIPEEYRKQIAQGSKDDLLKWGIKIFDCQTLEEIF